MIRSCPRLALSLWTLLPATKVFCANMVNWIGHGHFRGGNRSWGQNSRKRDDRNRLVNYLPGQACRSRSNRWRLAWYSTHSRHTGAAPSTCLVLKFTPVLCVRRTFATLSGLWTTTTRSWQQWITNRRQQNYKNSRRSKLWICVVQLQNEDGNWSRNLNLTAERHLISLKYVLEYADRSGTKWDPWIAILVWHNQASKAIWKNSKRWSVCKWTMGTLMWIKTGEHVGMITRACRWQPYQNLFLRRAR